MLYSGFDDDGVFPPHSIFFVWPRGEPFFKISKIESSGSAHFNRGEGQTRAPRNSREGTAQPMRCVCNGQPIVKKEAPCVQPVPFLPAPDQLALAAGHCFAGCVYRIFYSFRSDPSEKDRILCFYFPKKGILSSNKHYSTLYIQTKLAIFVKIGMGENEQAGVVTTSSSSLPSSAAAASKSSSSKKKKKNGGAPAVAADNNNNNNNTNSNNGGSGGGGGNKGDKKPQNRGGGGGGRASGKGGGRGGGGRHGGGVGRGGGRGGRGGGAKKGKTVPSNEDDAQQQQQQQPNLSPKKDLQQETQEGKGDGKGHQHPKRGGGRGGRGGGGRNQSRGGGGRGKPSRGANRGDHLHPQQQQLYAATADGAAESSAPTAHHSAKQHGHRNRSKDAPADSGPSQDGDAVAAATAPPSPAVVLKGGTNGVPMLLSRAPRSHQQAGAGVKDQQQANHLTAAAEAAAAASAAAAAAESASGKAKKKKNRTKSSKKKSKASEKKGGSKSGGASNDPADDDDDGFEDDDEDYELPEVEEGEDEVTATQALEKLPAQEVSITAATQVTVRKSDTTPTKSDNGDDGSNGMSVPNLLTRNLTGTASAIATKGKKKKKKKALSDDPTVNAKAARKFNTAVRLCVESGDPVAMRQLLRHSSNAHFCLEASVLETVMKAYVMAALFDDALYCLRNCALPATLNTYQTERILQCLPQNLRNSSAYTAADMINALCVATDFDNDPQRRTWFLRIVRGISLEFLEEATSARDRICSASCERLVRSGVCVVDAQLKRGKKPSELIVLPGEQLGCFVPESVEQRGIASGDAVSILPYAGPYPMSAESLDRNMIEATVTNTNPMVLRLQDKLNASLHAMLTDPAEGNVYRIDKLANRMGFNRQLTAAVAIATPSDTKTRDVRRPCPQLVKAITAMDESIDRVMRQSKGGHLPRGELTSTAALCAQAIPWSVEDENEMDEDAVRSWARLALDKYGYLEGLNASQRLAVEGAITNRLTLVQVSVNACLLWMRCGVFMASLSLKFSSSSLFTS